MTFVNLYGNISINRTIVLFEIGKLIESWGRKALSLRRLIRYDSQVADTYFSIQTGRQLYASTCFIIYMVSGFQNLRKGSMVNDTNIRVVLNH